MTAHAPAVPSAPADLWVEAYCTHDSPEVFHSIATPSELWRADPFDVETIHAEARAAFERLLNRAMHDPPPPSGAVFVITGEAGGGKTHLMRAFRTRAHSEGLGYCGYAPMTSEAGNYPRYLLHKLIDSLELPYRPEGPSESGLARLSTGLLELVPGLSPDQRRAFRDSEGDVFDVANGYADRLHATPRFGKCDLELLRVMLHLRRDDPRVRPRALMWLRCQNMLPADASQIGAVPRCDDSDPLRMLQALARLTDAIHGMPLVLLVDQLEDMANQSAPVERFRQVVDALCSFTDEVPNAVVVIACLRDYFKDHVGHLSRSKQDRLTRDPEPFDLTVNRSYEEIRDIVARRLAYFFAERGAEPRPGFDTHPYAEHHLRPLTNLRARDILDHLHRHHRQCLEVGRWVEPGTVGRPEHRIEPVSDLDQRWNDFPATLGLQVPSDEEELAGILAHAIRACSDEMPDGVHFGRPEPEGRYIPVEVHGPGNAVQKLWVAVCDKRAQGGGLGKQIDEFANRAGETPIAIVRTIPYPGRNTQVAIQIGKLLSATGGRTVQIENADWRRMMALEEFRKQFGARPDFRDWQRNAQPLSELPSLQHLLRLRELRAIRETPEHTDGELPKPPPPPPNAPLTPDPSVANRLFVGRSIGFNPATVELDVAEMTRHSAFLGGSGSGKSTVALNVIEQLLQRGIPAVLVDRKGDLCQYANPDAWKRPLGDPDREKERDHLLGMLDVAVYTPGEPRGWPLALPILPSGFDELGEVEREQTADYAAAALGRMMGFRDNDTDKGQLAILTKAVLVLADMPRQEVTLPTLRQLIESRDPTLIHATSGGFPPKYFAQLAQRLLTLELNNRLLLTGDDVLDLDELLGLGRFTRPGRVRLSVISTRFLADSAKLDFWVAQLLIAVGRWCGRRPADQLQAVFLFDEADIYLPAVSRPATKAPMENLLRRARSAGVGIMLATQSPGDFDYRCRDNIRAWMIGRVREHRALQKLRPLFADGRADLIDRLPNQETGEFHLAREKDVVALKTRESLIRTSQLSEERIVELARGSRGGNLSALASR